MPDHVHALMGVDPQFGVQRVVRGVLKGNYEGRLLTVPTVNTNGVSGLREGTIPTSVRSRKPRAADHNI